MSFLQSLNRKSPLPRMIYQMIKHFWNYPRFIRDFQRFKSQRGNCRFDLRWADRYPCLSDRTTNTPFDRHYVFHTGWAARILSKTKPREHIDISSSLYFASIASAFVPIKFYDYRPPDLKLAGLEIEFADLLSLPFPDNSLDSLSCMHVIEHIGLGRYEDPINPDADLKAISELKRVLAPQGNLLFVVPIGRPKVMFNAHRIYSYQQILAYYDDLKLIQFVLIPDDVKTGGLIENAPAELADQQEYGCGCFWFRKEI